MISLIDSVTRKYIQDFFLFRSDWSTSLNHENILVILCLDNNNKFLMFENTEEKHDK